jgi:hypothetical protein
MDDGAHHIPPYHVTNFTFRNRFFFLILAFSACHHRLSISPTVYILTRYLTTLPLSSPPSQNSSPSFCAINFNTPLWIRTHKQSATGFDAKRSNIFTRRADRECLARAPICTSIGDDYARVRCRKREMFTRGRRCGSERTDGEAYIRSQREIIWQYQCECVHATDEFELWILEMNRRRRCARRQSVGIALSR